MEGDLYLKITDAIKQELPEIHIHGFSPEEVLYGSIRSNCSIKQYLNDLKSAGVGSLPGTSAEILDQDLRDKISPGRITVNQWKEVITTAHEIGIPTTSTIMFGHVETFKHIADHLVLIREMQKQTGGFTEFVPLSFVNSEAPMFLQGLNGTQNIHLYVQGAGHIWPGSIYESINDPNSSQRIWEFFSKYDINGVIQ